MIFFLIFYFQLYAKIFFAIFLKIMLRLKDENLNVVDRILKILKSLHEEFGEKVVQVKDNLIRENCNLIIMNFNRTIRML